MIAWIIPIGDSVIGSHKHLAIAITIFVTTMIALTIYRAHVHGIYVMGYRKAHNMYIPWTFIETTDAMANSRKSDRHPLAILFERQMEPEVERARRRTLYVSVFHLVSAAGGIMLLISVFGYDQARESPWERVRQLVGGDRQRNIQQPDDILHSDAL